MVAGALSAFCTAPEPWKCAPQFHSENTSDGCFWAFFLSVDLIEQIWKID